MAEQSAVKRVTGEVGILESVVEEAMKNLSKPLWVQFAILSNGYNTDQGREACKKYLAYLDDVEKNNAP